jgi:hypothetical protein
MILHSRGGRSAAQANVGKILAADQNGLTLREATEGSIFEPDWADGEKYLKVLHSDGDLAAEILIRFENDNSARLKEMITVRGPNSLGAKKVRSIFRLLQQAFPSVETLDGYRMTGVRLSRPEELKFSLCRITGINTANAPRAAAA